MPKKDVLSDDYIISETGNWNVAADYSKLKIMKNLYLADEYSNIALFGYDSMLEELENPFPVDVLKLKGFERLINCLIMLIDNTLFAIKKGGKSGLKDHRKQLQKILKIMPTLSKVISSQRTKTKKIQINYEKYNKVLEIVLDIKSKINEPLNKNHLIFTDTEEFDPQKYKEQIMKDAARRG